MPSAAPVSPAAIAGVSLVVGEEELLVDRAVARLVAAAGPADNVRHVQAAGLRPGELAALTAPSLFGGGCLIVLHGTEDAAKNVADEITSLAADPPPETVLVLTHAGGAKGKALLAALGKRGARTVECPKITRMGERMQFIRGEFRPAGRTIEDSGVRALLDALGNDLRELAAACAQLAADTTGVIDQAVVARYYRGRAEASGFTVADRAVEGRLAEALELLRWALAVGVSPVLITSGLAQGVRLLGRVGSAPGASPTRRWPPRRACRRGRWTGSASSCGAGPRRGWPAPWPWWPGRTPRSKAKEPAPATPWKWPSGTSSPAGPAKAGGPGSSPGLAELQARLQLGAAAGDGGLAVGGLVLVDDALAGRLVQAAAGGPHGAVAASTSPASAASRNLRTEVFSADLTALLRCRAFSFCLLRLIWDLMFATRKPRSGSGLGAGGPVAPAARRRQQAALSAAAAALTLRRGRIAYRARGPKLVPAPGRQPGTGHRRPHATMENQARFEPGGFLCQQCPSRSSRMARSPRPAPVIPTWA